MANPHAFATVNHICPVLGIPRVSRLLGDLVLLEALTPIAEDQDQRGFAYRIFREEGPAVLGHLIKAAQRYLERGYLIIPEKVRQQVAEQFAEDDLILQFIEEHCELGSDCAVSAHTLFATYAHWARYTAELQNPLGRNTFLRMICDHPGLRKRT